MWILIGFIAFFAITGLLYVIITLMTVPGLAEERLGVLEELPERPGEWREDDASPEGRAARACGQQRQWRLWIDPEGGWLGRERILRQVRYLDAQTGELLRTEPDQRVRRRRVKQR